MDDALYPYWKRNLTVIWITQFFTLGAISLVLPFVPYYLRELAPAASDGQLRAYSAISALVTQVAFAIAAPVWGWVADRFGRKKMLLRAVFGASAVMLLMGFSRTVGEFIALRFIQGLLTGTMSASMTLVSCSTPPEKRGFALGILSSSFFSGDMAGLTLGGILAENFGYRNSFYITSTILAVMAVCVLFGAVEKFTPAPPERQDDAGGRLGRLLHSWKALIWPMLPILLLYVFASLSRYLDQSQLALYIERLNGGSAFGGKELCTSVIMGAGSLGAIISGFTLSRFIDKRAKFIAVSIGVVAGCAMLMMAFLPHLLPMEPRIPLVWLAHPGLSATAGVLALIPLRFIMVFAAGGMEPICHSWLTKATSPEHQGVMFGYAQTFRAIGSSLAHIAAGVIAPTLGLTAIYIAGPVAFLVFVAAVQLSYPHIQRCMAQNTPR